MDNTNPLGPLITQNQFATFLLGGNTFFFYLREGNVFWVCKWKLQISQKWYIFKWYTYIDSIHIYTYMHIYIYRERERERERHTHTYIYTYISIFLNFALFLVTSLVTRKLCKNVWKVERWSKLRLRDIFDIWNSMVILDN